MISSEFNDDLAYSKTITDVLNAIAYEIYRAYGINVDIKIPGNRENYFLVISESKKYKSVVTISFSYKESLEWAEIFVIGFKKKPYLKEYRDRIARTLIRAIPYIVSHKKNEKGGEVNCNDASGGAE